jgi:hypothetical protein
MPASSSTTRPRDPGRRVVELRGQGHTPDAIRAHLREQGYPEATIRNAVPGVEARPRKTKAAPAAVEPASTPVDTPAPAAPAEPVEPAEGQPSAQGRRVSTPARSPMRMPSMSGGGDYAGAVLGIFGMALVVNYMRGGPDQVKAWMRAKFLNDAQPANAPTKGNPGTGAANIYNVHSAMTRAAYNAAHPTGAGHSLKGGPTK